MTKMGLYSYPLLVQLPQQRKLLSLLGGTHQGLRSGSSQEFYDMAEYRPGDDVTAIDWKVSARHNQPIIKRFEATSLLTVHLLVDTGANMAATAAAGPPVAKEDIAAEYARAIASLCAARGDLLGLIVGNRSGTRTVPARSGTSHIQTVLRVAAEAHTSGPPPDVSQLLRRALTKRRGRSLMVLITDYSQIGPELISSMRRLQSAHHLVVLFADDYDPTVAEMDAQLRDVHRGAIPEYVKTEVQIGEQWRATINHQRQVAVGVLEYVRIPWASAGAPADVLNALLKVFEKEDGR